MQKNAESGTEKLRPASRMQFLFLVELPQARDLRDREREADGPGLGAGPRVLADLTHDLRLLRDVKRLYVFTEALHHIFVTALIS